MSSLKLEQLQILWGEVAHAPPVGFLPVDLLQRPWTLHGAVGQDETGRLRTEYVDDRPTSCSPGKRAHALPLRHLEIGCRTKGRRHTFSRGSWLSSARGNEKKRKDLRRLNFFCVAWHWSRIEVAKGAVRKSLSSTVRTRGGGSKNMEAVCPRCISFLLFRASHSGWMFLYTNCCNNRRTSLHLTRQS